MLKQTDPQEEQEFTSMPKLIESDFPFARLSQIAEHESWRKEVYRPVYYLHKWWARRLGSVFRGIILGACLDDDADFWARFYGPNDFGDMAIFDPFMGSGVTVGEAIKLGCQAMGRDINPVAVTACRAAFAHYDRRAVDAVYRSLETTVAPKLRSYFATRTLGGAPATVLYYFLVKVVACPTCHAAIDLFKRRIFVTNATPKKDPTAQAICPACGAITVTRFDATMASCTACHHHFNPQLGTVNGAQVCCPHCASSFKLVERMKHLSAPLAYRRYAKMMLLDDGRKVYEPFNDFDHQLEVAVAEEYRTVVEALPRVRVSPGYNTDQMLKHNYRHWHELFSDRQILCITHLAGAIREIEDADMQRLFAALFSGVLEFNNLFASFKGEGTGAVRHMFAHHVLKPELMPIEANLWGTSKSSGAFSTLYRSRVQAALAYKENPTEVVIDSHSGAKRGGINHPLAAPVAMTYAALLANPGSVYLSQGDSSGTDLPDGAIDLVISDPPFFDNVHYSELADFFYYWLNQVLALTPAATTRSAAEVQDTDAARFTSKLTAVFAECRRVLKDDGLFIFTYHHARQDGWTAVHRAIRHAGFACVRAYPIKAEMSVSMPLQQARSPIHLDLILVCRKELAARRPIDEAAVLQRALATATEQAAQLRNAAITLSLGDARMVLMGQMLCAAHELRCLAAEEAFLERVAVDIEQCAAHVLTGREEVAYDHAQAPQQLALFEALTAYLTRQVQ